jgi:hypothetical protein
MPLQMHSNDAAREAKPGIWIFSGKWVVLLPFGVFAFILIFKILMSLYMDWWLAAPIALLPLGLATLFVLTLVNGRPASFATDLLLLGIWRSKTWLFLHSCLDRSPELWRRSAKPMHPLKF